MKIDVTSSGLIQRKLMLHGIPGNIFTVKPFDATKFLTSFTSESDNLKPKRVTKDDQHELLQDLVANPFSKPYTVVISAKPNDLRAKYLAAYLFINAISVFESKEKELRRQRCTRPIWHTLLGTFQDKYRDNVLRNSKPGLMIFSNVLPSSSHTKLEKLRDLLELYCDVPKIVVTSEIDPVSFATNSVHYPISGAILLQSKRVVKDV